MYPEKVPPAAEGESVHELVNQKRDPAMVLGGSSRLRPSSSIQLGLGRARGEDGVGVEHVASGENLAKNLR